MSRESKISISILVFGFLGIFFYWSMEEKVYNLKDERIVLPNHSKEIYLKLPLIKKYLADLEKNGNFLPLEESELDGETKEIQSFLLKNKQFLADNKNERGQSLHNEMMTIRPAITSVLTPKSQAICKEGACYEAIKYNFVTNTTTRAIVALKGKKLLELKRFSNMQPDISQHLKRVAQVIALNAPEIKKELGEEPSLKEMSMANVRGSLNNSPCEKKEHLCVAPTFSYHERDEALWAIVDLTDLKLAAAKWAGLGKTTTPACIAERSLENRQIMENYCQKDTLLEKNGWSLKYRMTGSDGVEIVDVSYKGKSVLTSAKIVDWHVAYQAKEGAGSLDSSESYVAGRRVEYIKGEEDAFYFGYNDAMGCPMFSTSVVLPFNAPRVKPLLKEGEEVGFYLLQDYRNPKWPMACNYRYENRFEFYNDGSFRVVGVNIGRGCGENALYRPVMRIDFDLGEEKFYKYDGTWKQWFVEGEDNQDVAKEYEEDKYLYKIVGKEQGYYVEPNRGQFHDQSRGDHAKVFVTLKKEEEGSLDLLTLGSCCKLDEDGVERYLDEHESIDGEDLVFWYVPHVHNDAREGHEYCWADTRLENGRLVLKEFPCIVGPKFVPIVVK
jgi:hypothetical protein